MKNLNYFVLFFLFLLPGIIQAQEQEPLRKRILLSTETGGTIVKGRDSLSGEKLSYSNLRFGPSLGYFLNNNWVLGITGEYEYVKSNYTEAPSLYGAGVFIRYYLPFKIKKVEFLADRLLFLSEASFLKINYFPVSFQEVTTFDSMRESLLQLNLGINFRIWKQLYLEKSVRMDHFVQRKTCVSHRLCIEYHF